jgi:hypothetical protein
MAMKPKQPIDELILTVRGERVILSADLAELYGVSAKALNQAMRRNADRFPADFVFQLRKEEFVDLKSQNVISSDGRAVLRSQIVTLKRGQHAKFPPHAFSEHGAIMAATVLNSREAVAMSVYVVRAFVQMRVHIAANATILKRLAEIDKTLLRHDTALRDVYQKLLPLLQPPPLPPKRRIGFISDDE